MTETATTDAGAGPAVTTGFAATPAAGATSAAAPDGAHPWVSALPENLRPMLSAKGWDKFEQPPLEVMLGAYSNAEKMLGKGRLSIPDEGAPPEQWDALWKAIGRPDTPDAYQFDAPKLPDGFAFDEKAVSGFREVAHKLGLRPDQFQQVVAHAIEADVRRFEGFRQERAKLRAEAEMKLQQAWGGQYQSNKAIADRVVSKFAPPEYAKWLDEYGLKDDPTFVQFLHAVGREFSEDTLAGGAGGSTGAQGQIQALGADEKFRADLHGRNGSEARRIAQARWNALMEQAARETMPGAM